MPNFAENPGLLYVVATLLPLASFVLLLLAGGLKNFGRAHRDTDWGASLYRACGGDTPGKGGAYLATAAIGLACVLSVVGLFKFLGGHHVVPAPSHPAHHGHGEAAVHAQEHEHAEEAAAAHETAWQGRLTWAGLSAAPGSKDADRPGIRLELGYYIDHLAAVMFAMVTFIATLIHVFALGYMADETNETVEDHHAVVHEETAEAHGHHHDHAHFRRRGRYGRFFMFFSLFCFSMLNLILADNLFQVFISWELVGLCSYLLIGFYYERQSASDAANKAFITNRVGDIGFIVGLMIVWTYLGTFNFQEVFKRVRAPMTDSHGDPAGKLAGQIVRGTPAADRPGELDVTPAGPVAVLYPAHPPEHFHPVADPDDRVIVDPDRQAKLDAPQYRSMPYWMLVVAGLGVFLGCVGKSAQFPLQVWLPDAMEGPTPVSALVHSATMVAAGVYLVGRCFPLFTAEVLLTIAYTGGITLFVAATIAVVAHDIKKVLAYSTISQLGYMMLALGVGGWVAGLLHLLTHAFFKALLFLCSGAVIYGCHHEQDMRKMGGLLAKMPVTAWTMFVGVLAIAGVPLMSGWYSKDAILAESLAYGLVRPRHMLLLILPLVTAGITCFYMFRLWLMTFTGEPKDHHVHEHAHESPRVMTVPLVILAVFGVGVAWGSPLWNAEASFLGRILLSAQPSAVTADFAPLHATAHDTLAVYHDLAGLMALGAAGIGTIFAVLIYYLRRFDPADTAEQFPGIYRLLSAKWYFDEFYSVMAVRPALVVAGWCRWFDTVVIDGVVDGLARLTVRVARRGGAFDNGVVDGLVNLVANVTYAVGAALRRAQTGFIRSYILFLALAAVGMFAALTWFVSLAVAR
ncbi:MAG TPA: NADH-quinone oxidoreductase subunit L [Gemmataceae bacterium]|jgi:NADH-quinone oxidoreductase subunit L